ncbi:Protein FAR1-like sequence 9 [Apostasia shenzhenica]|uniref:Protein FAR1-like sequence 9 n=1 Tax=Apostasia shenzhenica TaxID=1088818 RepID=A0A2I0AE00_9ASPA|nr:Protein FAR1-like sequence 9 [Apostasia shenzhenica]
MVRFKADINGKWWINKLVEENNHELASPKERHLLRSHCSIHGKEAGFLQSMSKVGISWRQAEVDKDFMCNQKSATPTIQHSPLLNQAREVYTIKIYNIFQKLLVNGACGSRSNVISTIANTMIYSVGRFGDQKEYQVNFDSTSKDIKCTCKKFETVGLLCSHALRILLMMNVMVLSDRYIV